MVIDIALTFVILLLICILVVVIIAIVKINKNVNHWGRKFKEKDASEEISRGVCYAKRLQKARLEAHSETKPAKSIAGTKKRPVRVGKDKKQKPPNVITTSNNKRKIHAADECQQNSDCGVGHCQRSRIMYMTDGADSIEGMCMSGAELQTLQIDILDEYGLNVEDVLQVDVNGQVFLLISTGTRKFVVHQAIHSRLVESNIGYASDLAVVNGQLYVLNEGCVHHFVLEEQFDEDQWTFQKLQLPCNGTATAITSPHNHESLVVMSTQGTYFVDNGTVVRHQNDQELRVYGQSLQEYAVKRGGDFELVPNQLKIPDADVGIITEENRFYHVAAKPNSWMKKTASISDEPVFITRAVCTQTSTFPNQVN